MNQLLGKNVYFWKGGKLPEQQQAANQTRAFDTFGNPRQTCSTDEKVPSLILHKITKVLNKTWIIHDSKNVHFAEEEEFRHRKKQKDTWTVDNSLEIVFDFSTEAQVDVFSRNRNNLNKTWIICDNMNAYVAQMESSKSSKSSKANLTCWYFLFFQNIIHWWKQRFLNIFAKFEKFLNKTWTICDRKMSILQRKKAPEQKQQTKAYYFWRGVGRGGVENASHTFSTNDKMFEILHKSKNQSKPWISYDSTNVYFFKEGKLPNQQQAANQTKAFVFSLEIHANKIIHEWTRCFLILQSSLKPWTEHDSFTTTKCSASQKRRATETITKHRFRQLFGKSHQKISQMNMLPLHQANIAKNKKTINKTWIIYDSRNVYFAVEEESRNNKKQKKPEMLSTLRKYFRSFFHRWRDCC